jgi:hypothetical protein
MKSFIFRTLSGLLIIVSATFVILWILIASGMTSVGISPYYHHKLNETEAQLFDNALLEFREKVENGKFEEIQNELADGRASKSEIIGEIKKSREQFGKPLSSEFFRSSSPEPVSKYYENLNGTFYTIFYFTKTERGEFFEDISWVVSENDEAKILNYSGSKIIEWQIKNRDRERYINANYSNKIRIPFGERFIEIRY